MFFTESNPFDRIRLSGNVAAFSSTSGFEIELDIDDPRTRRQRLDLSPIDSPRGA
ncbi:hypothetical protein ACFYRL_05610 [Streptomyces goshikiensis]|uniref:hypothetical protein n=1 Tax=Streptomyces goshikiensis TaxID=1942 RepID=UPI00368B57FE